MKLYIEDNETLPAVQYLPDADPEPDGFTITTNPVDWDKHFKDTGFSYKTFRNEMITQFEPGWSGYNDAKKKALIRNFIYPSETTNSELNALYPVSERKTYRQEVMRILDRGKLLSIAKSITSGSKKRFQLQVDDSGNVTAKEIKTDETF